MAGICYYLLIPSVERAGYPSVAALIFAGVIVLIPFELIVLVYSMKKNQTPLFGGVIPFFQKLKLWQYLVFTVIIFTASGLLMIILSPVSNALEQLVPESYFINSGLDGTYARNKLIVTYILFFLFISVIVPFIEELYFRGYLLPRISVRNIWIRTLLHSLLFALYHTWSPHMAAARTIAVLPLIYLVQKQKNLFIGILAHIIINSIDAVIGTIFILTYYQ